MIQAIDNRCSTIAAEQGALVGRDIVCFSHDWTGDPLSRTHLMRLLARENRVLWVNSIGYRAPTMSKHDLSRAFKKLTAAVAPLREVEPNLFVFNPLALPIYGRPWARAFNQRFLAMQVRRAMRKLGFCDAISWIANPAAAIVAGRINEVSVIYHCIDEYTAISGVSSLGIAELEQKLLERADLVLVTGKGLYAPRVRVNPNTFLVRHGVDHAHFRQALSAETEVPAEVANLPRPVIGYFGLMSRDWTDVDLLERVAAHFHEGSLVLLGKVTMDLSALAAHKNVHLLGRKSYEQLPAYCKGFDVGIIPFPVTELTVHCNPLKTREYLAAGLPVVSTSLPEVAILPECRIAADHESFLCELELALAEAGPRAWRSELMEKQSWEAHLREISMHFARVTGRRGA